jgi:RND family efflux transporter MFP subunit
VTTTRPLRLLLVLAPLLAVAGLVGWQLLERFAAADRGAGEGPRAAPVEVAGIARESILEQRTFGGTLVARAQFVVAPKVDGRLDTLHVDLGDRVERGTLVAELDDQEFRQAVAEAEAALQVARANLAVAKSDLDLARRSSDRVLELEERRIASGSQVDVAAADLAASEARVQVASAEVARAEAALESARIRLGYTRVVATWPEENSQARVVSRRYVDAGATLRANDPVVELVDTASLRAVIFATERDHPRLRVGQPALLRTDAFPDRSFSGRVARIAPIFEESSRQTRVEVEVPNEGGDLKPGMYVRVQVTMAEAADAVAVPLAALVRRDEVDGVFVVEEGEGEGATDTVRFVPIRIGIRSGARVQVLGPARKGGEPSGVDVDSLVGRRVVVLGQQLVEDGEPVNVQAAGGGAGSLVEPARRVRIGSD